MTDTDFRLLESIAEIPAGSWNALAGSHPVLQHEFLLTLEDSGCVGPRAGWVVRHATLWQGDQLLAAAPLYEKHHSYGEYVFDWAWAEAYARHGLTYYPKLLSAAPFSPLPGARLLAGSAADRQRLLSAMLLAAQRGAWSSFHVLFPTEDEAAILREAGLLMRSGVQFHWQNAGHADFDAFLASLNHDKRKKIRQERRKAGAGLEFVWLDGHGATREDWHFFYQCYALTYAEHRSTPYLTPAFFTLLAERMPDAVRLVVAPRDGRPIACAWFLCDEVALYGRYWGALEFVPCLHFELCYYQAIEYAITHGLQRMEGGAQGEHKLARGLTPARTYSAHWLRDPRFADAVARYLERESDGVDAWLDELHERAPFRRA
jgi:predicted N-acyltransferase